MLVKGNTVKYYKKNPLLDMLGFVHDQVYTVLEEAPGLYVRPSAMSMEKIWLTDFQGTESPDMKYFMIVNEPGSNIRWKHHECTCLYSSGEHAIFCPITYRGIKI